MNEFYSLKVKSVTRETENASRVSLSLPDNVRKQFRFKPGQYLTFRFLIDGQEQRRSYSICSSPLDKNLIVATKRVEGGLVSNHINDQLREGDEVEVMPPGGRFFADISEQNYKTYYLFAAGSGITPMLSILRTVLALEKHSYVHLIYGNRSQDGVMFAEVLQQLKEKYAERFILQHVFSQAKSQWSDLWSSDKSYREGRIDAETVQWFINQYPPYAQNVEYYICGPGGMIKTVNSALMNIDVPRERIFIESFGGEESDDSVEAVEQATLKAHLQGEEIEVSVTKGQTLLRALIDQGYQPPYSCEGGVCATCQCTVKAGAVHMKRNAVLSEQEVAQGEALSCQSLPLSDHVEIVFEQR